VNDCIVRETNVPLARPMTSCSHSMKPWIISPSSNRGKPSWWNSLLRRPENPGSRRGSRHLRAPSAGGPTPAPGSRWKWRRPTPPRWRA